MEPHIAGRFSGRMRAFVRYTPPQTWCVYAIKDHYERVWGSGIHQSLHCNQGQIFSWLLIYINWHDNERERVVRNYCYDGDGPPFRPPAKPIVKLRARLGIQWIAVDLIIIVPFGMCHMQFWSLPPWTYTSAIITIITSGDPRSALGESDQVSITLWELLFIFLYRINNQSRRHVQ